MNEETSFLLELLKITLPALIVFLTAYYMLRTYIQGQLRISQVREPKDTSQARQTTPLRLQAYERLSLFCERSALPNLLVRVRPEGKTVQQLQLALLLNIQQEYEHNVTQQVYVSEQLWQIIQAVRDHGTATITTVADTLEPNAPGEQLTSRLAQLLQQEGQTQAWTTAQRAIRKEATLLFG